VLLAAGWIPAAAEAQDRSEKKNIGFLIINIYFRNK